MITTKRTRALKRLWLVPALMLLLAMQVTPVTAADLPPSPWQTEWLFGTVTINGAAAPAGTAVAVYVGGSLNASTTVDSQGRYGYTPQFYVTGNNGQIITFQVGAINALETSTFQGGISTRVNLSTSTTSLFVSTTAATNTGSSTVTLNGMLSDMGGFASVTVSFQYGTTISYGISSTSLILNGIGSFSVPVTGLAPNTLYHCKAVANSGTVSVSGNDMVFSTTSPVFSVSTSPATGTSATGATLNGNLNDLGFNSTANVYFQYGLTVGYGSTTATTAKTATGAFNTAITGLSGNQTYHFQAVAQGSTTVYGADMTFTTPAGTLTVTTGTADLLACNSARLVGNLVDLGLNSSVSVNFQWGTTIPYGFSTPAVTRNSTGTFVASISGLQASTTYRFKAIAAGSTSVSGIDGTFTTPSCGTGTQMAPNQFYGKIYINGSAAPAGTTISALVGGVQSGSTTTDAAGRYGYSQLFYLNGNNGDLVTFTVGVNNVPQTSIWRSGAVTNLDMFVTYDSLSISTGSATYVSATSATFGGTLTGLGTDTSATVSTVYSVDTSYGSSTTSSTSALGSFTGTASSLVLGTTYNYKAKAVGIPSGTIVYGTPGTYNHTNTLSVTTNAATPGTTTATLNGYLNSLGSNSSVTVSFYCDTNSSPTTLRTAITPTMTAPGAFTASLTGLLSGTTYYVKAQAVGSTTVVGTILSFTTGGGGALSVTTNAATVTGTTTATLNGYLNSLGSNISVTVSFFCDTNPSPTTSRTATTPTMTAPGAFTASLTGLTPGATYYVKAHVVGSTTADGLPVVSFIATPPVPGTGKLLGVEEAQTTAATPLPANVFTMGQFICRNDGTITVFKVDCSGPGNVKVAIYGSDVYGFPTTLLNQATMAVSAGWNTITFPGTPVASGNIYWLAGIADSSVIILSNNYTYGGRLVGSPVTYSSFTFPAPYDNSLYQAYQQPMFAGWANP